MYSEENNETKMPPRAKPPTPKPPTPKPPTCRELQAQINELRELIATVDRYAGEINRTKLDADASRVMVADIQSSISTATRWYADSKMYYEQAHAIFNDTLAASKQVAKVSLALTNFERVLANYYRLPWYKRIFRAPEPPKEEKK